ncbi:MAG: hypothetical protein WB609_06765 [Candidatus Cybelea sp.]
MRALSEADFLALSEHGCTLHPLDIGLLAIHTASPEARSESIADWPLGRRNRALLELLSLAFGPTLRCWVACPRCQEMLEFEVAAEALATTPLVEDNPTVVGARVFRLPTSRDVANIAGAEDADKAALQLAERCLVSGESRLSYEDLDAIGERMAGADPLAETIFHFDCPECGAVFDESLDLPEFVWAEVRGRANQLLRDVHTLASAYGWSEHEILALTPARRESYVEMIRA